MRPASLTRMDKVRRTDTEWREQLTRDEYRVLREAGTEAPFTGEYTDAKTEGVYRCRACGAELFRSDAKFESHCGWPSFYQPTEADAVVLLEDESLGMRRVEVRCAACDSHLGHVFEGEGYPVPTDQRWCINSVSLSLEPAKDEPFHPDLGRRGDGDEQVLGWAACGMSKSLDRRWWHSWPQAGHGVASEGFRRRTG